MWVEEKRRLRPGNECPCCCCRCCCCCCCSVRVLCSTAVMRRQSTDAMCMGRAVWVWRGHMPQIPEHDYFIHGPLASAVKTKQHTEHPRQHVTVVHKTHRGSSPQYTPRCHRCRICTLPRLRRMIVPAIGGLAFAWPRRTGFAFGEERVIAWCGANHLPCDVGTCVAYIMLVSCSCDACIRPGQLRFSWPTRLLSHSKSKNPNPIPNVYDDMGTFVRLMKLFFGS